MTASPPPVEAASISPILELANDPPLYPHGKSIQHPPLTLYIVRVPGLDDLVLTPVRPTDASVTTQEIEQSIYYIRYNPPATVTPPSVPPVADPESLRSPENTVPRLNSSSVRSTRTLSRKPVASGATPLTPIVTTDTATPTPIPDENSLSTSGSRRIVRKPVGGAGTGHGSDGENQTLVNPLSEQTNLSRHPSASTKPTTAPTEVAPPKLSPPSFSLIRRDPNSGQTWNVGTITLPIPPNSHQASKDATAPSSTVPFSNMSENKADPSGGTQNNEPSHLSRTASAIARKPVNSLAPPITPSAVSPQNSQSTSPQAQTQQQQPSSHSPSQTLSHLQQKLGMVGHRRSKSATSTVAVAAPPFEITLETLGYRKFHGRNFKLDDFRHGAPGGGDRSVSPVASSPIAALREQHYKSMDSSQIVTFQRHVVMAYTRSFTAIVKDAFSGGRRRNRSGSNGVTEDHTHPATNTVNAPNNISLGVPNGISNGQSPTPQDSSLPSLTVPPPITNPFALPRELSPGPGLRPYGYIFLSPWDRPCSFHTTSAGRSIQCHHYEDEDFGSAPGPVSSRLPPPANAPLVSELRYNLPVFDDPSSSPNGGQSTHGTRDHSPSNPQQKLGLLLKTATRRLRSSSDPSSDEAIPTAGHTQGNGRGQVNGQGYGQYDEDPLALGREKAGGGSRGEKAKLGKLIIYNEGLKMLDLVVAANMGIWGGYWDQCRKISSPPRSP